MGSYTMSTALCLTGIGLAVLSLYLGREQDNYDRLRKIYERFLPERDSCFAEPEVFEGPKYREISSRYTAQMNGLNIRTPIARMMRARLVKTIENPPLVLSMRY